MIRAVAVFESSKVLTGFVTLTQNVKGKTIIQAHIKGLKPNTKYAWHIHEAGDLRHIGCKGACAHYNPYNQVHGGLTSKTRHVGDLGNITTDDQGNANTKITTSVKLSGKYNVIGRSIVIHAKPDDLGKKGTEESMTTGSAGQRIACGVIGYASDSKLYF